jgi:ParB-like chromosome segregation protein Spo0J
VQGPVKDGNAAKGLAVGEDVDQSRRSPLSTRQPRGLTDTIVWRAVAALKDFPGNPRRHPERQLANLMKNIQRVWTNPILVDETCTILAGHGRLEAAKRLGMAEVPTVMICGLDENEKKAVVIADNRLPEGAVWNLDLLRGHLNDLVKIDFDVELTGFSTGEIDLLMDSTANSATADPADDLTGLTLDRPAISQLGDEFEFGRIACSAEMRNGRKAMSGY